MKENNQTNKKDKYKKNKDIYRFDEESFRKHQTTKNFKRKKQSLQEEDSWEEDWSNYFKK